MPADAAATDDEGAERALVAALREGSRQAAERLVDATYPRIFAALYRLCGDRDEAADLTQETYRKAWQSFAGFREAAQVSTWLFRIAYNTFLNARRRPMLVEPLDPDREAAMRDPEPLPSEAAATRERERRLRRAVMALPEDLRFAVAARFWGDVPVAEIARLEGITPPAVRKRLARAFAAVEAGMEDAR
jgi:RNA polymerase sigma-70 factor (ECF subfamily)